MVNYEMDLFSANLRIVAGSYQVHYRADTAVYDMESAVIC